jgi:hypothetical protein
MDFLLIGMILLLIVAIGLIGVAANYYQKTDEDADVQKQNNQIFLACGISASIILLADLYIYLKIYPAYKMAIYARLVQGYDKAIHVSNREMKKACEYINKEFNAMTPEAQVAFKSKNPFFESEQIKCTPGGGHDHWEQGYGI